MKRSSISRLAATIYVAFIVLWMVARLLIFDQFWLLALLNTAAEYLFVPLPVLLLFSLWKRDWVLLAELAFPLLIFVFMFGRLFWHSASQQRVIDKQVITVMNFNVLYTNTDYEAIIRSIQSANPDVVGIEELEPPMASAMVEALARDYPYNTFQLIKTGLSTGLLSKFPIESAERFALPPLNRALRTVVRMHGIEVHVIVVHLSPNNFFHQSTTPFVTLVEERYGNRKNETIQLIRMIRDLNAPVLLLCDCNMADTSDAYARLDTVLDDSFREAGWGMGHTLQPPPLFFRMQRIDYVWHTQEFEAINAYVGQDGGSDHLPIVAKLQLTQ